MLPRSLTVSVGRRHGQPDTAAAAALSARRHRPDYCLVALCIMLLTIGLVVIFSIGPALSQTTHVSSSYYVGKQLVAIVLGLIALVVAARVPLGQWHYFAK